MARSRLHLPTRLKGAGIRRMATVRDAAFIDGMLNVILPRFLTSNSDTTNTPTPGFLDPQLGSVLGRCSFNALLPPAGMTTSSTMLVGRPATPGRCARRQAASKRLLLATSATQMTT
eukprot:jgi/Tetstr1/453886/TSEL_040806.t1